MKNYIALALIALTITTARAQDPAHATEFREPTAGPGPNSASDPRYPQRSLPRRKTALSKYLRPRRVSRFRMTL
jgi:hypothetical protein